MELEINTEKEKDQGGHQGERQVEGLLKMPLELDGVLQMQPHKEVTVRAQAKGKKTTIFIKAE